MTTNIHLVDPNIHDTVRESLRSAGIGLTDSPKGASALVTQDVFFLRVLCASAVNISLKGTGEPNA